jgi:hypothetical protein
MNLVIHDASVSHLQYRNNSAAVIDFVYDPVVTGSNSPSLIPFKFAAAGWPRIVNKRGNFSFDRLIRTENQVARVAFRLPEGRGENNSLTISFALDSRDGFVKRNGSLPRSFCFFIFANCLEILKFLEKLLIFFNIEHHSYPNTVFVSYELFSFRHFLHSRPSLPQSKSRIKAKALERTRTSLFVARRCHF